MIKYKEVDFQGENGDEELKKVIKFNDSIFGSSDHYSNISTWRERIDDEGKGWICIALDKDQIIGHFVCYERSFNNEPTFYLFLCGVAPTHRRKGITKEFFMRMKQEALKRGIESISVCSIPTDFPNMIRFIHSVEMVLFDIKTDSENSKTKHYFKLNIHPNKT